ncbi:MAG TPA: YdcF family protein [Gemmatimonadaceae bacterium]|nr:YdcF family protein [Gemmatimonadaceae bacterium]
MPPPPSRPVSRILWSIIALLGLVWLLSLAGVLIWARRDQARRADAIVVLGAAQYVGRPSPVLRARLDHAIELYHRGMAPRLIFTGGTGVGDTTSEAAVSRRYALKRGVPASAIVTENEGHTTRESLRAVAAYLRTHEDTVVILVSDPFHMFRLSILARRMGLDPHTSPTRTSPISDNRSEELKYVLSESVKVPLAYIFERRER